MTKSEDLPRTTEPFLAPAYPQPKATICSESTIHSSSTWFDPTVPILDHPCHSSPTLLLSRLTTFECMTYVLCPSFRLSVARHNALEAAKALIILQEQIQEAEWEDVAQGFRARRTYSPKEMQFHPCLRFARDASEALRTAAGVMAYTDNDLYISTINSERGKMDLDSLGACNMADSNFPLTVPRPGGMPTLKKRCSWCGSNTVHVYKCRAWRVSNTCCNNNTNTPSNVSPVRRDLPLSACTSCPTDQSSYISSLSRMSSLSSSAVVLEHLTHTCLAPRPVEEGLATLSLDHLSNEDLIAYVRILLQACRLGITVKEMIEPLGFMEWTLTGHIYLRLARYRERIMFSTSGKLCVKYRDHPTPWDDIPQHEKIPDVLPDFPKSPVMVPHMYLHHGVTSGCNVYEWEGKGKNELRQLFQETEEEMKWRGGGYAISIRTNAAVDGPYLTQGDHTWINLHTPDGKVYAFGLYRPEKCEAEKTRYGLVAYMNFRIKRGTILEDWREFFDNRISNLVIAINARQFHAIKQQVEADHALGAPYHLTQHNCSLYCIRLLRRHAGIDMTRPFHTHGDFVDSHELAQKRKSCTDLLSDMHLCSSRLSSRKANAFQIEGSPPPQLAHRARSASDIVQPLQQLIPPEEGTVPQHSNLSPFDHEANAVTSDRAINRHESDCGLPLTPSTEIVGSLTLPLTVYRLPRATPQRFSPFPHLLDTAISPFMYYGEFFIDLHLFHRVMRVYSSLPPLVRYVPDILSRVFWNMVQVVLGGLHVEKELLSNGVRVKPVYHHYYEPLCVWRMRGKTPAPFMIGQCITPAILSVRADLGGRKLLIPREWVVEELGPMEDGNWEGESL